MLDLAMPNLASIMDKFFLNPESGEWVPFTILLNLEERGIGGTRGNGQYDFEGSNWA